MATEFGFASIGGLLFIFMSYIADVPVWLKILFGIIGATWALMQIIDKIIDWLERYKEKKNENK